MRAFALIALVMAVSIPLAACGDDEESDGGSAAGGGTTQEDSRGSAYGTGGGGDDDKEEASAGGGDKGQTLKIAADAGGALAFDKSSLTAEAGNVTISMDNPSSLPHAVAIEGNGVDASGETVMEGGVSEASADLEPGEYEFYCPVGNHRDAGMEGTLTVN